MQRPQPFRIDVAEETRQRIRHKVAQYPWHEMPDDGIDPHFIHEPGSGPALVISSPAVPGDRDINTCSAYTAVNSFRRLA